MQRAVIPPYTSPHLNRKVRYLRPTSHPSRPNPLTLPSSISTVAAATFWGRRQQIQVVGTNGPMDGAALGAECRPFHFRPHSETECSAWCWAEAHFAPAGRRLLTASL